jgi:hypothetical protein
MLVVKLIFVIENGKNKSYWPLWFVLQCLYPFWLTCFPSKLMHKYTPTINSKNTKHVNMFSKSTCTYESHSLQSSQQGRKSKYRIELHTTPQTLQVANLELLPHIQHMWRGIVKRLYSKVVVGKETIICILHLSCDTCIYDITL